MIASAFLLALPLVPVQDPAPASRPAEVLEVVEEPQVEIRITPSSVKSSIDRAIRHLRGQQRDDGSFDGSVWTTSQVLVALAESPRKYRVIDGPFMTKATDFLLSRRTATGLIVDPAIGADETRIRQTLLAAMALAHVELPGYLAAEDADRRALELAAAALDAAAYERVRDAGVLSEPRVLETAELLEVLASQGEDGNYGQARPAGTARSIRDLTATWHALRAAEVKDPIDVAPLPVFEAADRAAAGRAMVRGAAFLVGEAQLAPGQWGAGDRVDPGITAMVVAGLLHTPQPRDAATDAAIEAGVTYLLGLQKPDGSIHGGQLQNYVTSAAVLALTRHDAERHGPVVARARAYLTALQADEGEGYGPEDRFYGGVGYGGDLRPDLSNLQMALEALAAAGADAEDPAMQKALKFLERTQNRKESNDVEVDDGGDQGVIRSGDDGGAAYMPGDSKAGFEVLADGTRVPRSYGSMTFALLKGYLLVGLSKDDPRVQAAHGWLQRNYTLDSNPGFAASADPGAAYQGLFYYFLALATALDLYGEDLITDGQGAARHWRSELAGRLVSMQRGDGSWANDNSPRWFEGNPTLATAYALTCLGTATQAPDSE